MRDEASFSPQLFDGESLQTWVIPDRHPGDVGPWLDEPDRAQWVDQASDFDCLMLRGRMGSWCGYVGVPSTHPWYRVHYGDCPLPKCPQVALGSWCQHSPESVIAVHGGITFSDSCQDDEDGSLWRICHFPAAGRSDEVWWFGFDCAHCDDLVPDINYPRINFPPPHRSIYRDFEYVRLQCRVMAAQLAVVARNRLVASGVGSPQHQEALDG